MGTTLSASHMCSLAPMLLTMVCLAGCGGEDGGGSIPETAPADLKKDPLSYRKHEFSGGSVAVFDNWTLMPAGGDATTAIYDSAPNGRQNDFALRLVLSTPTAQVMQQLFTQGPMLVRQYMPGYQPVGTQQRTTFGGDEAMVETLEGRHLQTGDKVIVRCVYIRKKDIAVLVMGFGSESGHKEFGRAVEIVAQSITFSEDAIEAGLTGSWHMSNFSSTGSGDSRFSFSSASVMTIYPNGTFTEQSATNADGSSTSSFTEGNKRGTVIRRGQMLTFRYDNEEVWNATYELRGGALMLNGKAWFRQ